MSTTSAIVSGPVGEGSPRGIYVIDPAAMPFDEPAARPGTDTRHHGQGVGEKWVVKPSQSDPDEDRFPVSVIDFPPNLFFPRHWHTDGEFVAPIRGEMMVGGEPVAVGGYGYNDARTIYGAEAAGPEGCEFLMIRRAWAKNNVMLTDDEVDQAVGNGITNSQDRVAPLGERGLHLLDPAPLAWDRSGTASPLPPDASTGTAPAVKKLVEPRPGEDRFPIFLVELAPDYSGAPTTRSEGVLLWVLDGTIRVGGATVVQGALAYVDAGVPATFTADTEGARLAVFSRAPTAWKAVTA
jgi:hypothetical protein